MGQVCTQLKRFIDLYSECLEILFNTDCLCTCNMYCSDIVKVPNVKLLYTKSTETKGRIYLNCTNHTCKPLTPTQPLTYSVLGREINEATLLKYSQ